ncbi:MAG: LacI family transcriptional regulator [Anaerolineae bacterium]|nr:LacI family transcriptional regulator [Anaerolineae bacterium]
MPTIHDVAAYAKVSASTVSHVINNTRFVSTETRARVLEAIEALGYKPNILARSLRRQETATIGLVVPDNSNPFFAAVARAIEDAGFAEGYNVILCNSDNSETKEAAYIDVLVAKQVDGLILSPWQDHPSSLEKILEARLPVVAIDRVANDLPIDQVLVDNEQGGYLAGQYLVQLGHRRIGCIAPPPESLHSAGNRIIGFRRALAEAGVELNEEAVISSNFRYSGGEAAMCELLKRNLDLTAVFTANDLMAAGAIQALRRAQLQVPEDISIIGFDYSLQAMITIPLLTTIAQPITELGRVCVSLLLKRIKEPATLPSRVLLPTQLIEQESCRAVMTVV